MNVRTRVFSITCFCTSLYFNRLKNLCTSNEIKKNSFPNIIMQWFNVKMIRFFPERKIYYSLNVEIAESLATFNYGIPNRFTRTEPHVNLHIRTLSQLCEFHVICSPSRYATPQIPQIHFSQHFVIGEHMTKAQPWLVRLIADRVHRSRHDTWRDQSRSSNAETKCTLISLRFIESNQMYLCETRAEKDTPSSPHCERNDLLQVHHRETHRNIVIVNFRM